VKKAVNRKALAAGLAMFAVVAVSGCGIELDSAPQTAGIEGSGAVVQTDRVASGQPRAQRVSRSQGVVRISGQAQGSLTERLVRSYENSGTPVQVTTTGGDESSAFAAFCRGQVDVVDSARPISPSEYRRCVAQGIVPVQFQVASDAAVLAIKNETDVGVDCLSYDEAQQIFRSGSPINSWSQVGYDSQATSGVVDSRVSPRLKVAGPDDASNVFGFLGQYVLGIENPTLASVRSDYQAYPTDAGVRRAVVGSRPDEFASQELAVSEKVLDEIIASIADAEKAVRDARAEVRKGIDDGRSAEAKARDRRKLREARQILADLQTDLVESRRYVKANRAAARRFNSTRGTLGLFRFSYYEAFEEQLRPVEISSSNDFSEPECIFPSQVSVTNATYPLARQLLLTVSYKNLLDGDINDFLTSALSNAQEQAQRTALVPIPDDTLLAQQTWLNGSSEPDVVFYDVGGNNNQNQNNGGSGQNNNGSGQDNQGQ
jgi:ABC-type phosphate transport system substrate-binding protein